MRTETVSTYGTPIIDSTTPASMFSRTDDLFRAKMNDTMDKSASIAMEVGNAQGIVETGKRGWIYTQVKEPGGGTTTLEVFVPSGKSGKSRVKFKAGQVIMPKYTSDRSPGYWTYEGIPPSTKMSKASVECSGSQAPDFSTSMWPGYSCTGDPLGQIGTYPGTYGEPPPIYRPGAGDPLQYIPIEPTVRVDVDSGWDDADPQVTPSQDPSTPSNPADGDLWYDGKVVRKFHQRLFPYHSGWDIISAGNSGEFAEYFFDEPIGKGRFVFQREVFRTVGLCGNTIPESRGRLVGMTMAETLGVHDLKPVQKAGIAYYNNAYAPGTIMYLDVSGGMTTTPPLSGTGYYVQRVGVIVDQYRILLDIGPAVKRSL